ncbi:MAG TPA: transglycosylase SLT domain-containing protein [Oscillatoriales cyanobacterium M59_W2019_021]|nr:MAG: tail length tape measure protein [Cyanobacteria bacterium J055]HIK30794.1 transglycosylase SLT domain-containing protein [Oscillatoriales cyanobacterium M4454_W2019_049]HIK50814.1 transglycosylase SLT domain-containing protein [Oscillatoriales cyanobacterium M59_W2019_021]
MGKLLKQRTTQIALVLLLGLGALLTGAGISVWRRGSERQATIPEPDPSDAKIAAVLLLPPEEQKPALEELANGGSSIDRHRARYLLAVNAIAQKQGEVALEQLNGLEKEYPVLGGYILLQRARAYELLGDASQAQATYQQLAENYGEEPVAAEALFALSKTDPQSGQAAIEKFPLHPRTAEIARQKLAANPDAETRKALLLLLAQHLYLEDIGNLLAQLGNRYGTTLTPQDWETIAFGYWEKQDYKNAGKAYAKAPRTPQNLYRTGRGLQLGGANTEAKTAYRQVVAAYPETEEGGLALLRLARLSNDREAIPYLDRLIANFPDLAAEALLDKSKILDRLGSEKSATQARQSILHQYGNSDSAAELRYTTAQGLAQAGQYQEAWKWAEQIIKENPQSEYAPEAGFWVGKWAQALDKMPKAKQAFEYVVANYPQSYYAWRSAVYLGWDVGDFTTVRQLSPTVEKLNDRLVPPAGSETIKELYALGQDRDAWTQWHVEFTNRIEPSFEEQLTDGMMRMGVGDTLDGIFMLSNLADRDDPEDKAKYEAIAQQPAYWETLYPFPYFDLILYWSAKRQINPLMTISLIRQESRFMPSIRSVAGAVGLMQVLPETGAWIAEKANEPPPKDLTDPNDNIRLGTLYLDYTHDTYNDNSLFAIASYNAGPGNVDDWKQRFRFDDPDVFAKQIPFPETNDYISSVFGNYWNYLRLYNPQVKQQIDTLKR